MSHVRPGVLLAIIVFAAFAAYAFLAPATYRATALVLVDSVPAGSAANLPEPLEAARRLSEAVLDRSVLDKLATERAGSSAPGAKAAAASVVRQSLEIDTSDGHAFSIGYKDTSNERAQRVCNDLARHAADRAPQVLIDRAAERAQDQKRQQQTQELAAFLSLHPEAAAEASVSEQKSPDNDPALSALTAERSNLEARLQELDAGVKSDNPYIDTAESDPNLLKRRLAEVNKAATARRATFDEAAKAPSATLAPELRTELRRLVEAVTKANSSAEPTLSATLRARVAATADAPKSPIDPNRPLLLFFGVVFGTGFGVAYALVLRAAQTRRTKSSRPPTTAPTTVVQMPPAPAVPTGLGPAVPAPLALPAPSAAPQPIVPIRQRTISSNPAPSNGAMVVASPTATSGVAEPSRSPSSHPPPAGRPQPRRFASTLVLPPSENPAPNEEPTPEPGLATANQVWEEQIRAHAVPGFAVVRPPSEPPPRAAISSAPPPTPPLASPTAVQSVAPAPPAANPAPRSARSANPMKVTQPLGSFVQELLRNDPSAASLYDSVSPPPRPPEPPRSPLPQRPSSGSYSYVSSAPPPPESAVTNVRPGPPNWSPDPSLHPDLRRPICEQLYPLAVEGCFVIAVVGVPDSAEQKSIVAAELALALAASGHPRILLMDGDMQSPRVHRLLRVDMPISAGFSQQLRARVNGNGERRWTVVSCGKTLHVLGEGLMRSPGLLLSQQFSQGLSDLRSYYDFIVIDGPTESLGVESQALDAVAHGVVFVSKSPASPALSRLTSMFAQKRLSTTVVP